MAKYIYVVFADAAAGREDEFNDWYTKTHMPDMIRADGFLHGQRFGLIGDQAGMPGKYLAIYEMDTDDPERTLAELRKIRGTSAMMMSDSFDSDKAVRGIYQALNNPVRKRDVT